MEKLNEGILTPAYGRDYTSAADVKYDFYSGKDFVFNHYTGQTTHCSVRDFVVGARITLRYAKLRKAVVFTKKGNK